MRKLLLCVLPVVLLVTALASPMPACINDREVGTSEREFKSSYSDRPSGEPVSPGESTPSGEQGSPLAVIAGLVLLAGAALLGLVTPLHRR